MLQNEPSSDVAICWNCDAKFEVSKVSYDVVLKADGSIEIDLICPQCSGYVDYSYSDDAFVEYEKWSLRRIEDEDK